MRIQRDHKGITIRPAQPLESPIQKPISAKSATFQGPDASYTSSHEYANIGWSLTSADINGDMAHDLIIGFFFLFRGIHYFFKHTILFIGVEKK